MFRTVSDFLTTFAYEREKTVACLDAIPEAAKGRAVADGHRDLARLGWHLATTCLEMPAGIGLVVEPSAAGPKTHGDPVPATMKSVRDAYAAVSASLAEKAKALTDADLLTETNMYGETWKKGYTLFALVLHQAHHRGQMTVLMRQAGIKPPDVYGPAKEDWAGMGMQPPAV
jgi:uncharacterized damage-inducible protein DinB